MNHYSASQINQFMRCPSQWKYRYIDGLKLPPSSAMVQGISYHKGLETNFVQKIETHEDLPKEDVKDAFATSFDAEIKEVEFNEEETSEGIDKVKGELKDVGMKLIDKASTDLFPLIQPVAVEKKIDIEFENVDYTLTGIIDLIDDKGIIHEEKTAAKSPSKDKEGNYIIDQGYLVQGAIYCLGTSINRISYDYAIKTRDPKIITIEHETSDEEKAFVLSLLGQVDHAIKSEAFYPNRSSWMCSKKSCGYWRQCEKDYNGKVRE